MGLTSLHSLIWRCLQWKVWLWAPPPVRTLASLAAHRANVQKYTGPSTAEGKAARFFHGTKLPISLETKGGGETNRGTKLRFRHGGEEENWAGKAPRGGRGSLRLFGRGNDDVGTGRGREERQADPHGGRGKVPGGSPVCLR